MISVVIPVFNEETIIGNCLDALVEHGDGVGEIIVVDNGSCDATRYIVADYCDRHPHIRLIDEPRRGVANARNAGFDAATNDIVGRIDADTWVTRGWADIIERYFKESPDTAAVTGLSTYHDSPIGIFRKWAVSALVALGLVGGQQCNLHGANMAIRREYWHKIRTRASRRPDVHEDVDLAIAMTNNGFRIDQLTNLNVTVSARRRAMSPAGMWTYNRHSFETIRNQGWKITFPIRFCAAAVFVMHTVQWPLYKNWDFERRRFTWRSQSARVSPVTVLG